MRVIKDSYSGFHLGVDFIEIITGVGPVQATKSGDKFNDGEPTKFRWLTGKLKSTGQQGSVLIWETNFQAQPDKYEASKDLEIRILLEGDYKGSAQEYLGGGAFDISDIGLSEDQVRLFLTDLDDEPVEEEEEQRA